MRLGNHDSSPSKDANSVCPYTQTECELHLTSSGYWGCSPRGKNNRNTKQIACLNVQAKVEWDWILCYSHHKRPTVLVPDESWKKWRIWWNENWQEQLKNWDKICPDATLSTTNPILTNSGLNPGFCCCAQYKNTWLSSSIPPWTTYEATCCRNSDHHNLERITVLSLS
jgi:hypothetical protein